MSSPPPPLPTADTAAAIVLAAGSGSRFGGAKQFATLAGERLVDRAVRLVTEAMGPPVLTLPEGVVWDGAPVAAVVAGGSTRTESVRNAVATVPSSATTVVVHDIARPLVSRRIFTDLVAAIADGADCAVPVWALPDTLKAVDADGRIEHRGREGYVVAQSPMAFTLTMLHAVFEAFDEIPIEESIAVEQLGGRVVTVPGDPWSHHVVEPRDLEVMEQLLGTTGGAGLPD